MKITPVMIVDAIEPSLEFWVGKLGFEKTVEIPEGDKLGFAILQKGDNEVMFQTWASVKKDTGSAGGGAMQMGTASLYIEVDDFADTRQRLSGADVVVPERTTFYGMREIFVREPGRHLVGFATREK
jgi:uncharacterized glyoxalase superfamily protein PhnB